MGKCYECPLSSKSSINWCSFGAVLEEFEVQQVLSDAFAQKGIAVETSNY